MRTRVYRSDANAYMRLYKHNYAYDNAYTYTYAYKTSSSPSHGSKHRRSVRAPHARAL